MTTQMTMSLRYSALSDVGRVRKDNQDSGFASERLLVVADGVGGAARGDIASSTAVQILRRLDAPPPEDLLEAVAGAIHRAHDRIAELVEEDPELEGTSTTVTAALFDGRRIGVGHVGDSRGYLLRDGNLSQLTRDHTFVQSLIDEGRLTEEESRTHPHRNLILRAVDGVHETDPDLFVVDLASGDRLLLCSDGCSGVLDSDRLADILGTGTVDYAVVELVRAALEAGSSDNVTCVVADVVDFENGPADRSVEETSAAATTGPMLVGAAAEQPRRSGSSAKSFFRGHRGGDTGELDPVPGDEAVVAPTRRGESVEDPEVLRYAPRAPRRFAFLRWLAIVLAAVVVLALIVTLGYRWTQDQYYVAVHGDQVAIFQGVQAEIPGLMLTSVHTDTNITIASLSNVRANTVRSGIVADDLDDAKKIVSRLGDLAQVCPEPSPSASPEPSPSASDSAGASPQATSSPGSSAADSPTGAARDEAQRSPTGGGKNNTPADGQGDSPSADPTPTLAPPDCVEATP